MPGARRRACAPCRAAHSAGAASQAAGRLVGTAAGTDRPRKEGGEGSLSSIHSSALSDHLRWCAKHVRSMGKATGATSQALACELLATLGGLCGSAAAE